MLTPQISNPKRGKESRIGRASWYEYYAGYSTLFVADALAFADLGPGSRVLDPWNGSGTTTQVAAEQGYQTFGFDLNPVMVLVAKARLLDAAVYASIGSILDDLLAKARSVDQETPDDPLESWFVPESALTIRGVERSIQTVLMDSREYQTLSSVATMDHVSPLAALFYVALFRTLRRLLSRFRCSNPTWLKQPCEPVERAITSYDEFSTVFREQVTTMAADLNAALPHRSLGPAHKIDTALSASLPIGERSVDAVISSPPYCTRIDYVKKTGAELALLGARCASLRMLRDRMLGTPTVLRSVPEPERGWGLTCRTTVDRIYTHRSYASKSYYWKTYIQYFDGLYRSLKEIDRVLSDNGKCIIVVQDSYYKDLHIDLATITVEMAESFAWARTAQTDFLTSKTIVGINSHAMGNGNPKRATETVLAFQKAK